MSPNILPLLLLAVTVGIGLIIIGKQGINTENSDKDTSSNTSN